jgi:hypothetical protein
MMKKKNFALMAILLTVLCLSFAGEALALPKWISVKLVKAEIKERKGTTINDSNHLQLMLHINITNNNRDGKIVKAIFDQAIDMKGRIFVSSWYESTADWNFKYIARYTKPKKIEIYPGQVYKGVYSVPIDKLVKRKRGDGWKNVNYAIKESKGKFKLEKLGFDLQVSTRR